LRLYRHADRCHAPVGRLAELSVTLGTEVKPGAVEAVAFFVPTDGGRPDELATDRATLDACGVAGKVGWAMARAAGRRPSGPGRCRVGAAGAVSATDLGRPSSRSHRHGQLTGGGTTMPLSTEQLEQVKGAAVTTSDGQQVGVVEGIYLDETSGQPEWALVNTPWIGKRDTFVPLREATFEGGTLSVPYSREQLQGAPMIDPDGALDDWEEAKLYSHYGIPHPGKAGLRMTRYYDLFPNRRQWHPSPLHDRMHKEQGAEQ
jgi:sporulation protein YlmC with PRC-barrel domain